MSDHNTSSTEGSNDSRGGGGGGGGGGGVPAPFPPPPPLCHDMYMYIIIGIASQLATHAVRALTKLQSDIDG